MLGEMLQSSFGLLCRSSVLQEGAAGPRGCNWERGSFPVVASPRLPGQHPLAKAGRIGKGDGRTAT